MKQEPSYLGVWGFPYSRVGRMSRTTTYFITGLGVWVFSLRSADDKVDVGAIAKSFGGGGHTHAAGFSMDFQKGTQFFQQLLDNRIKS